MPNYRLYCLKDGRFISAEVVDASDDAEAVRLVVARERETDCEIWEGRRFVATVPLQGSPVIHAVPKP